MVNPLLTILLDLFLIGSALSVTAAIAVEYLATREPHVGTTRPRPTLAPRPVRRRGTIHHIPAQRRRAA